MEKSQKVAKSKEVIALLAKRFPKCFVAEGEAKPLKIGIFQDLSDRMQDEPELSKTVLRTALRQYTSSWRYLHGLKVGAERVDLDGNSCGVLSEEHVTHAQSSLKESKDRAFSRQQKARPEGDIKRAPRARKPRPQAASTQKTAADPASTSKESTQVTKRERTPRPTEIKPVDPKTLSVNQGVRVVLGKSPVPATIKEIQKDELLVQLNTGMIVKVSSRHVIL